MTTKQKRSLVRILASAVLLVIAWALPLEGVWKLLVFLVPYAVVGWDVLWKSLRNIAHGQVFDENFLMLIAAVGAFALGEGMEGAAVMLLYEIGELLQAVAVGSSRGAIAKLMELKSDSAILLEGEEQREVAPEELTRGEVILLRKGAKVPAECTLLSGESAFDTRSITGES